MYTTPIVLLTFTLAATALASPAPSTPIIKRDPSDKSGTSQIAFSCYGLTLPAPGGSGQGGSSGSSYFHSNLGYFHDGSDLIPTAACTDQDSFCSNCLFDDANLSSPTNVTACWNPIEFSYNGYDYDSQASQPTCGHQNSFGPFSDTITAICYFDA
ncbi:hypothetical protein E0Z10_g3123 [Xylaria hypoxylon]|uniref:Uncharacterized protein n=1 Tax=Xylaria hypoxylon TaxID=37992 RepID=A0A4Z0Z296_9PEZI|nr:hypothetical protein E0Z10_g3123 [Xylaria hypoxylon]